MSGTDNGSQSQTTDRSNVGFLVPDFPGRTGRGRGPADTQSGRQAGDFPAGQPTTALDSDLPTDDVKHPVSADQSWPLLRHALAWVRVSGDSDADNSTFSLRECKPGLIYSQFVRVVTLYCNCLLYTSPSPRDISGSRMPSSA